MNKPRNQKIDRVYDYICESTRLDTKTVEHGYEIHFSNSDERELLIDLVQDNKVVFENPGRIDISGHEGSVLLLPDSWRS